MLNDEVKRRDEATDPLIVPRTGHSVQLVPVDREHLGFLYQLAIDETVGFRWRFNGAVPKRDDFEQFLWTGMMTQLVVSERKSGGALGLVSAYNADLNHGYAYVAAVMVPEAAGTGVGIEAIDLFIGHLFGSYRLRKLNFEVPEYNLPQFASALEWLFREEGNLIDHTYYNGRFWNRRILALYREDYQKIGKDSRVFGRRRRDHTASS